jgi:hypothetical protein
MVKNPRAPLGARKLRPLNAPVRIQVETDDDNHPVLVQRRGWRTPRAVARIQDRWRIDDEWWRTRPISRLYYALLLEDDLPLTIFHNLITETWYEQRNQPPSAQNGAPLNAKTATPPSTHVWHLRPPETWRRVQRKTSSHPDRQASEAAASPHSEDDQDPT